MPCTLRRGELARVPGHPINETNSTVHKKECPIAMGGLWVCRSKAMTKARAHTRARARQTGKDRKSIKRAIHLSVQRHCPELCIILPVRSVAHTPLCGHRSICSAVGLVGWAHVHTRTHMRRRGGVCVCESSDAGGAHTSQRQNNRDRIHSF